MNELKWPSEFFDEEREQRIGSWKEHCLLS